MSLSTTFLNTVERRMAWMPYEEKIQIVYFWVKFFFFLKQERERGSDLFCADTALLAKVVVI
jgi:hypothetical protein